MANLLVLASDLESSQHRAPRPQRLNELGIPLGGGFHPGGALPQGSAGRLQRAHDMKLLCHINADDATGLGRQHNTHLGFKFIEHWQFPGLSPGVALSIGAQPELVGAGVQPSTLQTGEAGRGVFPSRSCRKELQRPLPASHLGSSFCKLSPLF